MIRLGEKATDRITGFTGVVVAHIEYLNGCEQYELQPEGLQKENRQPLEAKWFDVQRLTEKSGVEVGGPGDAPPGPSRP